MFNWDIVVDISTAGAIAIVCVVPILLMFRWLWLRSDPDRFEPSKAQKRARKEAVLRQFQEHKRNGTGPFRREG